MKHPASPQAVERPPLRVTATKAGIQKEEVQVSWVPACAGLNLDCYLRSSDNIVPHLHLAKTLPKKVRLTKNLPGIESHPSYPQPKRYLPGNKQAKRFAWHDGRHHKSAEFLTKWPPWGGASENFQSFPNGQTQ